MENTTPSSFNGAECPQLKKYTKNESYPVKQCVPFINAAVFLHQWDYRNTLSCSLDKFLMSDEFYKDGCKNPSLILFDNDYVYKILWPNCHGRGLRWEQYKDLKVYFKNDATFREYLKWVKNTGIDTKKKAEELITKCKRGAMPQDYDSLPYYKIWFTDIQSYLPKYKHN